MLVLYKAPLCAAAEKRGNASLLIGCGCGHNDDAGPDGFGQVLPRGGELDQVGRHFGNRKSRGFVALHWR